MFTSGSRAMLFLLLLGLTSFAANQPKVEISVQPPYRMVRSNGIADHQTGQFPNRRNPHQISAQAYHFRMPLTPQETNHKTPTKGKRKKYIFGVALNGVVFDPSTAEYWKRNPRSGWNYEALTGRMDLGLDSSQAHVQPNGAYHYHGIPRSLVEKLKKSESMVLIGYAADGFPIYSEYGHRDPRDPSSPLIKMRSSYQVKKGSRPSGPNDPGGSYDGSFTKDWEYVGNLGDLDECNGRFGMTPEYPQGTYHYYITDTFPYVPRYFKGAPDNSFLKQRGNHGGRSGPGGIPSFPPPHHHQR
ncbi:MAG: YHYH protein [Verrucomicrobiota bacterium]